MEEIKKIVPKLGLLAILLLAMNFAYERWRFPADLALYSEAGAMVQALKDSTQILYLGESSDFTIADEDIRKLSISQFLAEYFPSIHLEALSKGALHAGNYRDMLGNIPRSSQVKTVVVTMNLRSFDATWIHSKLETALQKEMVLLQQGPPLWRRLMLSLRNYEIKTEAQRLEQVKARWSMDTLHFPEPFPYATVSDWDSAVAARHDTARTPASNARIDLACHYIKNFAFQIDVETNPRIKDFDRIVTLAKEHGWDLVFNLLPENVVQAGQLVGPELTWLMRQNRDVLLQRYDSLPGVTVVDGLETLPGSDFVDQNWTTEHYHEHGRNAVAGAIAEAIRPQFRDAYRTPPAMEGEAGHSFANDCEGSIIWSQMQSLDPNQSHSGKSASATGGQFGQFGITFTYPVPKLESNYLDSLQFSCWVFQTAGTHNASIAWEAGGEKTGYLWDSLQFHAQLPKVEEWQLLQFKVPLWPNIREAEIIKIYPYNPSSTAIWFDDIQIHFVGKD